MKTQNGTITLEIPVEWNTYATAIELIVFNEMVAKIFIEIVDESETDEPLILYRFQDNGICISDTKPKQQAIEFVKSNLTNICENGGEL